MSDHKFKIGQTVYYTSGPYPSSWRGGVFKIMQLLPRRAVTTNIGPRALTSRMIEWSKKGNSTGQCDRAWHSTTTHRPSCLYKRKGVGGRRSPTAYRRFATAAEAIRFAVEEFPPSEPSALGCRSEMSASIATIFVGYMRVAIIRFGATCPVKKNQGVLNSTTESRASRGSGVESGCAQTARSASSQTMSSTTVSSDVGLTTMSGAPGS